MMNAVTISLFSFEPLKTKSHSLQCNLLRKSGKKEYCIFYQYSDAVETDFFDRR